MATTQEPESEATPPENGTTIPSEPVSTQPTTPPTPPPSDPPIRREYVSALEETLRENNRRIQQLQDQVEQVSRRSTTPQQQEPVEVDRNEFFNDPHKHTRSIVADELSKQIKPLLDFVQTVPRPQNDTLKNRIKYSPQYSRFFSDPLVEQAFDAVMQSVPNPTEQSAIAAANQVIGWQATGQLRQVLGLPDVPSSSPTPTPAPTTVPNNPAPPYMPPTPPATPRNVPTKQLRELTENERRIARERGMTHEQFLEWMDVPPSQVVQSKIGRNG